MATTSSGSTDLPVRKCNCSGHCGPPGQPLSRRDFLGLVGIGSAALVASPAWGAFTLPSDQWDRWRRDLFAPTLPRRYLSGEHADARMHLGGIGTGNFEIGSDGQFTTWQLFNTLRDGHVPFHLLVRTGTTTRLLQTTGGPDWPRVKRIEMTGEYPLATLRFQDPDLPVQLALTAFSPFAPLETRLSSMPVAVLNFQIHNPGDRPQTVSLAALLQNPVGYDAAGDNSAFANPCFGGNFNEMLREGSAHGLFLRAESGIEPTLNNPVAIVTLANLKSLRTPPPDRPANLKLEILGDAPALPDHLPNPAQSVLWLEEAPSSLPEAFLRGARQWVESGLTLVVAGRRMPLLEAFASWTGGRPVAEASPRPDIVFEDFEHGYGRWKVEGEAFGTEPVHGTLPNQQVVSGFLGKGLVNTYLRGDDTTGRLISQPFTIERHFIRFLVGGGSSAETQIRLLVDGKVVEAAAGKDLERLEPSVWDVSTLEGRTAHLEIVDNQKGPWGHINIDQIEFSDLPGNRSVMLALEELLPARFSRLRSAPAADTSANSVVFEGLTVKPDTVRSTTPDGTLLLSRPLGRGRVVLVAGPVLDPARATLSGPRQRAYAFLCGLAGAQYKPSEGQHPKSTGFGTLALATLGANPTVAIAVENWQQAWETFSTTGRFGPVTDSEPPRPTPPGRTIGGAVASTVEVPAGATVEIPFLLAWHYPNKYNNPGTEWMGCHYTTQWESARAVIREAADQFTALHGNTRSFHQTFYASTLPYWLLDCLTANAAILRHIGIVFRIANGDVYGWEGSNGCCDPTCTHVWGYEQTLSRLFPDLERDMRRIDFKHQQREDGGVNNRTQVPSPPHPTGEQPFADGHASCILKAYREGLNQTDDGFLREYWPHAKRAVEYLIARDAKGAGGEPAGILQDDQWNTYDEALHGVTTFISGYYLAALRAGEEWGRRMGDVAAADRFHSIFEKGQKKLVELCWNGEYFQQHLPDYQNRQGEVGPGCMSDQLIGQWWAHQLGLGYILPKDLVVAALRSVFKYNFKSDLTGWRHAPRAFAGASDKGLIICTWPKGGRPAGVMLYSDEVWTGIEYQVAAHLIYEGMAEEGFAVVKAARDRYDGIPRPPFQRNPWNEIECGGHYARAMSSWSLLLALSGWEYDGPRQALRIGPRHSPDNFKSFFAGPAGWGALHQTRQGTKMSNEIAVVHGRLDLSQITLASAFPPAKVQVALAGQPVESTFVYDAGSVRVSFAKPVQIATGQTLAIGTAA
jgi:non-lysosomal glucosylceramidase